MEPLKPVDESEMKKEDWMNKKWRPAMGWMYMAVCIFDFIVAPILWAVIQFWETQSVNDAFRQWQPITLQGAGLFHMAMGAILGVAAWGRTQEKLIGTNYGNTPLPPTTNGIPSTNTENYPPPSSYPTRPYNPTPAVRAPIRPVPPRDE